MTTPTLPETLASLAQLLPDRILAAHDSRVLAWDHGGEVQSLDYDSVTDMKELAGILEADLRARCDAPEFAHTLALALVSVLGGEGA